jgi:SAM-dependent methyltransferase
MDQWRETKYVTTPEGLLYASRDPREVSVGSILITDLVASRFGEYLPNLAKGIVLDLGCGMVPLFGSYSRHADQVICLDWPNSPHEMRHVDIACDLSLTIPIKDNAVDTVILSDVLEHISDPENLLAEIHRVCRPEANLLMSVPFFYWLHEEPHDYFRYTRHGLAILLDKANMNITHLEAYGGPVDIISDIIAKLLHGTSSPAKLFARSLQAAAATFGRTKVGTRFRRSRGDSFPLGYFLVASPK